MSDPAERLANFPPLLQSSLTRLALEIIDSTKDEREHIRAWTQAAAETEKVTEDVRKVMRYVSSVVEAIQAQGWRMTDTDKT
jgi:hypothetical protein